MAGIVDFEKCVRRGNEFEGGSHFGNRAEGVASAMNEERGRGQLREMAGTKLRWFSRRMKRVGEQQQSVDQLRVFGDQDGGLAPSVGMAAQKQASLRSRFHERDSPTKAFAV